jgi:hypothetical protein
MSNIQRIIRGLPSPVFFNATIANDRIQRGSTYILTVSSPPTPGGSSSTSIVIGTGEAVVRAVVRAVVF